MTNGAVKPLLPAGQRIDAAVPVKTVPQFVNSG
jgi:hypothetical protein